MTLFDSYGGDFDFSAGASDSVIAWLIERKENKPGGYAFFDVLLNGGVLFICMTAGFYGFAAF